MSDNVEKRFEPDIYVHIHVACYYPTNPTDYLSTTKGMSMGSPVAVNIDFWGYL